MAFRDYSQLPLWQKALQLLLTVYQLTKQFPDDEKFGLVSNMRRAANSTLHNFAEGYGRFEARDKTRFYKISRGSTYELHSESLASRSLEYLSVEGSKDICDQAEIIINELDSLIISIEKR